MKTILLSLTLLIAFPVFSQNYRTVLTDSEVYFDFKDVSQLIYNDNQEEVKPCRVILTDSFQVLNNETVIYYQYNQEFEMQFETYYDSTYQMNFTYCFSTNDTGFLSYKTILQDDGTDIYFNRFHDSIFIQTQAILNDTWTFYRNSDGSYFEASVSNITNDNFLGLTDSIKTIFLQAKDSLGNDIISPYDTLSIRISKNYGLIEGFNMFRFPFGRIISEPGFIQETFQPITIVGLPQQNAGIKNLTAADVYDYDIGDEYHWINRTSGGDQTYNYEGKVYEKITINNKQFSINADTVYYDVYLEKYRSSRIVSYPPPYTAQSFDTLFVGDTLLAFNIADDNHINTYPLHYDTDSVLTWIQSEDGTQKTIRYWDGTIWNTSGCDITEVRHVGQSTFHKGLGRTYSTGGVNYPSEKREFVYYNKNGVIWGTPLNIDSLSTVLTSSIEKQDLSLKVFPNPATDLLNFQLEESIQNAQIRIYSTLGQLMETQNINSEQTQFNVSDWQNGMYFYGIFVEGEMVKSGQVLIE